MELLFPDIERTNLEYSIHGQNEYDFYNESAMESFSKIRHMLNSWFLDYPFKERKNLKSRLKKDFSSAFFELYIFTLFKKLGFEIEVNPRVNGNKTPDFLVKKGSQEIIIEVAVNTGLDEIEKAKINRKNDFYNFVNNSKINDNFFLHIIKLEFLTDKVPSLKKITTYLSIKIDEFQLKKNDEYKLHNEADIKISDETFILEVNLIPRNKENSITQKHKPIGIYPTVSNFSPVPNANSEDNSLLKSIKKKIAKYKNLGCSYLIFINNLDHKTAHIDDYENIIWGSLKLAYFENNENTYLFHANDGLFAESNSYKNRNVNGIFIFNVVPAGITAFNYYGFKNSLAENSMNWSHLGLNYSFINQKIVNKNYGKNLEDIFQIKKNEFLS